MSFTYQTLKKAVSDDRDFLFDLTRVSEIVSGATVSSATVTGGSGLSFGAPTVLVSEVEGIVAGKGVSVRISGGTAGTAYTFAVVCTLSTSRVVVVPARIYCEPDAG